MRFAPGSSRLLAGDVARLRRLAATGAIAPSDRITVLASGPPALAAARFEAVARALLPYNIVANQGPLTPVPPNRAIIESERYLVTLPPCPNWSKYPPLGYTNTHASNFGCATAIDLGLMVANPADLASGVRSGWPTGTRPPPRYSAIRPTRSRCRPPPRSPVSQPQPQDQPEPAPPALAPQESAP